MMAYFELVEPAAASRPLPAHVLSLLTVVPLSPFVSFRFILFNPF